jgi:hypothetical protein
LHAVHRPAAAQRAGAHRRAAAARIYREVLALALADVGLGSRIVAGDFVKTLEDR